MYFMLLLWGDKCQGWFFVDLSYSTSAAAASRLVFPSQMLEIQYKL